MHRCPGRDSTGDRYCMRTEHRHLAVPELPDGVDVDRHG
jgi:hypothetical protein